MDLHHEKREIAFDALDDVVREGVITGRQAAAVRHLREAVFNHDSYGRPDDYEFKEFRVEVSRVVMFRHDEPGNESKRPGAWSLSVSTCVGRKGDEGTMAEVFGRERRLIFVGRRGGLSNHLAKDKKRSRGWWAVCGLSGR